MPPPQALDALAQLFADEPAALKIIDDARALAPQEQAQAVAMIIQTARGQNAGV